ncbi:MAG: hypothetical protein KGP35_00390 [Bacteroidetes bacterium]|nr:hypothetical protein [Bacteroidota bacterium]
MFQNRKLLIATKHGKEKVIQPLLEASLRVECFVVPELDTDQFGTFSGEIPRTAAPDEAAEIKCRYAMEKTGVDLAIASEGSFGSHPQLFFVPANEEWLILIDQKNSLKWKVKKISTVTNFSSQQVNSAEALKAFAATAQFPSHALILRDALESSQDIVKGIHDLSTLLHHFERMYAAYGSVWVETDMRAMHNPMRMQVIADATQLLIEKLSAFCPQCSTPGFEVVNAIPGLPCSACSQPTRSVKSYVYACQRCSYQQTLLFPNQKETEDPMYCDFCNP